MSNAIARKLETIQEKAALTGVDVANVLGTRVETVSRWKKGKAFPQPDSEERLLQLEYVVEQLADFYEPRDARLWLFRPQRPLKDRSAAELIGAGSFREVLALINQLRDGVFA